MEGHQPGPAATCQQGQTCTICQMVLNPAGSHDFGTDWKSDSTYHWHECDCGEKKDVEKHTLTTKVTPATFDKPGKVSTICSVCKKVAKSQEIQPIKTVALSASVFTYDGKTKNPTVSIKDTVGKKISFTYYTIKKSPGRKNIGSYTYKISFSGRYKGTKSLVFSINPKSTEIVSLRSESKGFTAKWKKQVTQTTGYVLEYADNNKMKSSKTITISDNTSVSKKVQSLNANKRYYVRVRTFKKVGTKKYLSDWSRVKSVVTK